jgi:hypothetical protein
MELIPTHDKNLSPISRVPQDILTDIFRRYIHDWQDDFSSMDEYSFRRLYKWVESLSCVCQSWHSLLMNTPEFFASIHMFDGTPRHRILSLLALSQKFPLTVAFLVLVDSRRAPGQLELLRPHMGRVRSLLVSAQITTIEVLFSGAGPAPAQLEVLNATALSNPVQSALTILPASLPRLRELTLRGSIDWAYRTWHASLRSLCLLGLPVGMQGIPLRSLLEFLRGMRNLQNLEIQYPLSGDVVIDKAATEPLHLANLMSLILRLRPEVCAAVCRDLIWAGGRIVLHAVDLKYYDDAGVEALKQLALALRPLLQAADARRPLHRLTFSSIRMSVIAMRLEPETGMTIGNGESANCDEHGLYLGMFGHRELARHLPLVSLSPLWMGISLRSLTLIGIGFSFIPEEFSTAFAGLDKLDTIEVAQSSCPALFLALSLDPDILPALSRLWIRRTSSTEQEWIELVIQLVDTFSAGDHPRRPLQLLQLDLLPHLPVSAYDLMQLEMCAERVLLQGSSHR